MRVLRVVTLTLLAALTLGQMDGDFCKDQQPTLSTKAIPMPDYSPEFVTTLEVTRPGSLAVDDVTLHFSTAYQILTADYRKPTERIMAYVFPRKDTYMESTFKKGRGSSCTSEPLEDSTMANDYNIHRDPKTKKLTMPAMSFLISHTHIRPPVYMGPNTIRGIPAQGWYICAYQAWTNETIAGKLYYSSKTQMPGSTGDVPLKMDLQIKTASTGAVHAKRYDYFNYVGKINKDDKHFQIPSKMYCKNAVTADNLLPQPPYNFEFQAIQKDLGDINAIPAPKPALAYRKETYSFANHLYVQDEKSPWNLLVTEVETRIVHDYTAGLQYDINVSTGACEVHPIDTETADFTKVIGNFVTMKSPKDFFQLTGNNYQYIGEHHYFDRDITADVYTSVTQGGSDLNPTYTMMTWWFASKSFLSQMKYDPTYMMPLRFRVQKSDPADTMVVDFYQFTSPPSVKDGLPDLTPCFPLGSELYLQITFKGSFNSLYLDNPSYFHSDFETAMLGVNITSMVRIAQFRVKPVDNDHMVVQFTLLDKPRKQGNALNALPELSNKKIWPLLKNKIDTGTFFLTVHNDFGVHKVMATGYRVDFKDPKSFSGRAAAVAAQTSSSSSSSSSGYSSAAQTSSSSSSSSSGYSSGAMGGLAIGMLLLGLILGFVVIKLIKRHRDGAPDISMEQLGKRT